MRSENLNEYRLVREEMKTVKDCMTHYLGYVLGGSGAAVFGLAALAESGKATPGTAYAAMMMSLLISMVLSIVIYKFYSHNRYAGYSKLLSHETFPDSSIPDIFTWETCVEQLRESEASPVLLYDWASKVNIPEPVAADLKWMVAQYVGSPGGSRGWTKPPTDRNKFRRGAGRLLLAIIGKSKTSSWGFPPFVTAVFFVLCTGFLAFGEYSAILAITAPNGITTADIVLVFVAVSIAGAQGTLWFLFCRRLQALMDGNATVDAFFWRFMPIRVLRLREYGILQPSYPDAGRRIDLMRTSAQMQPPGRVSMG